MTRARVFFLLILFAIAATRAHGDSVAFTLTIAFNPPNASPGDPCFGTTCTLYGTVQSYLMVSGPAIDGTIVSPFGTPAAVNGLPGGQSLANIFTPTDPCFGQNLSCTLGISFLNGSTTTGGQSSTTFPTFFLAGTAFPSAAPTPPPILPIGTLTSNLSPTPPPVSQSGSIVAYDAPVVVGSWSVTATPAPEPSTLILFGSGLAGFVGVFRRKLNR